MDWRLPLAPDTPGFPSKALPKRGALPLSIIEILRWMMSMNISLEWMAAFVTVLSAISFACLYITQPKA